MRAGEHHPKLVVADLMRNARAVGAGANVVHHGSQLLTRPDRLAAQPVQRAIARDPHDPCTGIVRHTVAGPGAQSLGERLLDSVLGDGQVTRPARQRGNGQVPTLAEKRCPDRPLMCQSPDTPASRRSSTVVAGIIDATLIASSRSAALM